MLLIFNVTLLPLLYLSSVYNAYRSFLQLSRTSFSEITEPN